MHPIIVFDTDCVLCAGMVRFVLTHERDDRLRFVGAWSDEGLALAATYGFSAEDLDDTFLVVRNDEALTRSEAGLAITAHLRAPWRWLALLRVVPRPLRDGLYTAVARRRYRWFGRRQDCTRVPAEQLHRFLGLRPTARREDAPAVPAGQPRGLPESAARSLTPPPPGGFVSGGSNGRPFSR